MIIWMEQWAFKIHIHLEDWKVIKNKSFSFRKYINDTIRTMYTGEYYTTGDYILVADTVNGDKEIYRWH